VTRGVGEDVCSPRLGAGVPGAAAGVGAGVPTTGAGAREEGSLGCITGVGADVEIMLGLGVVGMPDAGEEVGFGETVAFISGGKS
jgi:hypothetical protein